jgi:uncharacterized metal-binding protein
MPGYETHNKFNYFLLLILIIIYIVLWYAFGFSIKAEPVEICLSIAWAALHQYILTPDFNWNSTPNRKLGPLGWVFRKTIRSHREGFTHSYIFWAVYFIIAYFVLGWWTLSGVLPIFGHLILDKSITKIRRLRNRIKRWL